MASTPKTQYKDIKDISLVDFLDVEAEQTVVAHDIWKDKAAVVIGKRHLLAKATQVFTLFFFFCTLSSLGIEDVPAHTNRVYFLFLHPTWNHSSNPSPWMPVLQRRGQDL